jgi:hypothetical protein
MMRPSVRASPACAHVRLCVRARRCVRVGERACVPPALSTCNAADGSVRACSLCTRHSTACCNSAARSLRVARSQLISRYLRARDRSHAWCACARVRVL